MPERELNSGAQPRARKLSLAALTLAGTPAPEFVRIAAGVGCSGVSLSAGLTSLSANKRTTVVNDTALRRETAAAFAETGVALDIAEGLSVEPDVDFSAVREALLVMRDLGAPRFNTTLWDTDRRRASGTLRRYCDLASELGLGVTVEFTPLSQLASLADAVALAESGAFPGLQILADSLHLARCGATPADLAAVAPGLIGFAQLCDGPLRSAGREAYFEEALYERQAPGEGELPLRAFVAALPPELVLSLEVPMRSLQQQGVSAPDRARRVVEAARALVEAASA